MKESFSTNQVLNTHQKRTEGSLWYWIPGDLPLDMPIVGTLQIRAKVSFGQGLQSGAWGRA